MEKGAVISTESVYQNEGDDKYYREIDSSVTPCSIFKRVSDAHLTDGAVEKCSNVCGNENNVAWVLDSNRVLTFFGRGEMMDFDEDSLHAYHLYNDEETCCKKVIIEDGITNIGDYAFYKESDQLNGDSDYLFENKFSMNSIDIPSSVNRIGNYAFFGAVNLVDIDIPSEVASIGNHAFYGCESLKKIKIPDNVENLKDAVFARCLNLKDVDLPKNLINIADDAFYKCKNLDNIKIPSSVKEIGERAFYGCESLKNIEIPFSVTKIGLKSFCECKSLTSIEIPAGVTSIEDWAFAYCSSLSSITIPESVKDFGYNTFYGCDNLKDVYYAGSWLQWIKTGNSHRLTQAKIHFAKREDGVNLGKVDIAKASIKLEKSSYTYDGKAKTPSVTVKVDGKTLILNTDYTVAYSNNINAGTAKATVTGKGNYKGSKSISFIIAKAGGQSDSKITCKKSVYKVAYGTKPFKINASSKSKITFTSSKPKLVAVDKKSGRVVIKNTGVATITIKAGKESAKVTVKVSPKRQSIKSVKSIKGRKLSVKWGRDKMASGYQVQVSTDKNFKKNTGSKNIPKTSYVFTKLKTGKKYYIRVRSYRKSGKETLYGVWSKTKRSGKIK